jgi:hypothetical protein
VAIHDALGDMAENLIARLEAGLIDRDVEE